MNYYPKISIIVPIYNVEPYLRRCLDSLVNQTLRDIEIIYINDCSPDNSLIILKEYAQKDNRIIVINFEKNQGVSVARNAGIKKAKGEYFGTVDPDDYIDIDYYEKLYLKARETDADIVNANLKIKNLGAIKEVTHKIKIIGKICSYSAHWMAIYKMDLLKMHSLEYPVDIKAGEGEDVLFVVKAYYFANKVEFVEDVFYHYIKREYSATISISESYGMRLVFDFINKTIIDKEEYAHFFSHFFAHFFGYLRFVFERIIPERKRIIVQDMVEIYRNRKYPVILESIQKLISVESLESVEKLYEILENNSIPKYYPKIEINNLQNRELYIWGAGIDGAEALLQCEGNGWKIESFLDSNASIKEFNGYNTIPPEKILTNKNKNYFIIISSRIYANEIAKICE